MQQRKHLRAVPAILPSMVASPCIRYPNFSFDRYIGEDVAMSSDICPVLLHCWRLLHQMNGCNCRRRKRKNSIVISRICAIYVWNINVCRYFQSWSHSRDSIVIPKLCKCYSSICTRKHWNGIIFCGIPHELLFIIDANNLTRINLKKTYLMIMFYE